MTATPSHSSSEVSPLLLPVAMSKTGNLAQPVFDAAARLPQSPALFWRERTIDYEDLARDISRLAGAFEQLGLKAGDAAGLLLYNTPAFVTAYFALLGLGVAVIPVNTRLTGPELETILNDAGARLLVSSLEFFQAVRGLQVSTLEGVVLDTELLPDERAFEALLDDMPLHVGVCRTLYRLDDLLERRCRPADPFPRTLDATSLATLIYTSGTTGKPKGVMLSHGNILADAQANAAVIEVIPEDRFITVSPLFHVFGQTNILVTAMLAGASVALVRKFSPRAVLEAIGRHRVTFLAAVPTMYLMMLTHLRGERQYDTSSLRVCHSGAAPMSVDTFHEVEQHFGAPVQEGYGLSEASSIVCSNPLHGERKPGSVGLPLAGIEIEIRRDDASVAAPDEIGELHVRGDVVMLGYYNRPEETATTLLADGWLRTRDLAFKDADGYIHIVDRVDDLINIGGVKVYPREIEEVLYRHPDVAAAAVTGYPSTLYHESIKAFIAPRDPALCPASQDAPPAAPDRETNPSLAAKTPALQALRESIIAHCKESLADYKIPKHYEFVNEIPQGATGKILRKVLRERE